MNNIKIVYKKPTQYDNNSVSTSDLDESVLSADSDEINNNQILRNSILKEINNDIITAENNQNSNRLESSDINTNTNTNRNTNNDNNNNYQNLVDNHDKSFLYNIFIKYLKLNQIDFLSLTNKEIFTVTIKKFISENKLNQEQILDFLNLLKNKINEQDEKNNLENNIDNNINTFEKMENFDNLIKNEEYNYSLLFDLGKNDINTWIFLSVILISFIIIIMIIIYKK